MPEYAKPQDQTLTGLMRCPGPHAIGNPPVACEYITVPAYQVPDWQAEGWHLTVAEADAAYKAGAAPVTVSAEVAAMMADLSKKTNPEIDAYAAGLALDTAAMVKADKLAAIQAALLAASK